MSNFLETFPEAKTCELWMLSCLFDKTRKGPTHRCMGGDEGEDKVSFQVKRFKIVSFILLNGANRFTNFGICALKECGWFQHISHIRDIIRRIFVVDRLLHFHVLGRGKSIVYTLCSNFVGSGMRYCLRCSLKTSMSITKDIIWRLVGHVRDVWVWETKK